MKKLALFLGLFCSTAFADPVFYTDTVNISRTTGWAQMTLYPQLIGGPQGVGGQFIGAYVQMRAPLGQKAFMYGIDVDVFPGGEQIPLEHNIYDVNAFSTSNIGYFRAQSALFVGGGGQVVDAGDNPNKFAWVCGFELDSSCEKGFSLGPRKFNHGIDMSQATMLSSAIQFAPGQSIGWVEGPSLLGSAATRSVDIGGDLKVYGNTFTGAVFLGQHQGLLYGEDQGNVYLRTGVAGAEKFFGFLANGNTRYPSANPPERWDSPGVHNEVVISGKTIHVHDGARWRRLILPDTKW